MDHAVFCRSTNVNVHVQHRLFQGISYGVRVSVSHFQTVFLMGVHSMARLCIACLNNVHFMIARS